MRMTPNNTRTLFGRYSAGGRILHQSIKMTKLAIILGVVLVNSFCDKVVSASYKELDRVSQLCRTQERATDNDVAMWRNDIKPKPRIAKCLDACVGEKLGMLVNNRLNVDAIINVIVMDVADQMTISFLKAVVNECKSITDRDRCESSAKILDCINYGARKRGLREIF